MHTVRSLSSFGRPNCEESNSFALPAQCRMRPNVRPYNGAFCRQTVLGSDLEVLRAPSERLQRERESVFPPLYRRQNNQPKSAIFSLIVKRMNNSNCTLCRHCAGTRSCLTGGPLYSQSSKPSPLGSSPSPAIHRAHYMPLYYGPSHYMPSAERRLRCPRPLIVFAKLLTAAAAHVASNIIVA